MMTPAVRHLHASHAVTYVAVLLGMLVPVAARATGNWSAAGLLLALAVVADTFDGRFARRFARTDDQARVGIEIDSLSDVLTFGLTPIMVGYLLLPIDSTPRFLLWSGAAFFHVVCAITRLAVYNVVGGASRGFVGLPVPVAALIWSTVFLGVPSVAGCTLAGTLCGAAMISSLRVPRPTGVGLALFTAWPLTLVAWHAVRLGILR